MLYIHPYVHPTLSFYIVLTSYLSHKLVHYSDSLLQWLMHLFPLYFIDVKNRRSLKQRGSSHRQLFFPGYIRNRSNGGWGRGRRGEGETLKSRERETTLHILMRSALFILNFFLILLTCLLIFLLISSPFFFPFENFVSLSSYTIISLSVAQPQSCHLLYNRQNREGKNKDFASIIIFSHVKQRELNNHIARFNFNKQPHTTLFLYLINSSLK